MSKWREVRLGEIADINMGQSPKSIYYNNDGKGTKFLQGNRTFGRMYPNFDTYTTKIIKLAYKGDILLTVRAPVGNINIANDELCIGRGIASIRGRENHKYLYYGLIYNNELLRKAENGTTYASVNKSDLENFKFKIPDFKTQEKIAQLLSTYDELIENNNRRIEILEKAAEEIYKEWFVRMRFPGYKNAKFIKGIPEGWEVKKLSDVIKVADGTHDTPKEVEVGIPLIIGRNIVNGAIDFNSAYNISIDDFKKINVRSAIYRNDILYSNIGTIGTMTIVNDDNKYSVKNLIILKTNEFKFYEYIYLLFKSESSQDYFNSVASGASQKFVSLTEMRKYKIILPSEKTLTMFTSYLKNIFKLLNILREKNQNLIKQRDLLLPRLMNATIEIN